MNKQHKLIILSTVMVLLLTPVFFAAAGSPQVYISAVSPSKSGYAVDESVTINAKIKWADLTANKTISIQLWNSTDALETLESYTIPYNVSGTITEDGSYSGSWTPTSDLTEEVETSTYYLKVFGTDGLELDSESLVILVADESIRIIVTWEDQNNDRIPEKNEAIAWEATTTWQFVEVTESHSLYVDWGDGVEELIDTISVTAGTGDDTSAVSHGFATEGEHTVVFKLKDATGSLVVSQTVKIDVGSQATTPSTGTDTGSAVSGLSGVWALISANWQWIAIIGGGGVAVWALFIRKPEPESNGKKKGK